MVDIVEHLIVFNRVFTLVFDANVFRPNMTYEVSNSALKSITYLLTLLWPLFVNWYYYYYYFYGAWSLARSRAQCAVQKAAEKCINTYNGQWYLSKHLEIICTWWNVFGYKWRRTWTCWDWRWRRSISLMKRIERSQNETFRK